MDGGIVDILVGNELLSGAAVYLDARGEWVESFEAARLFGKDEVEQRDAAVAATKATGRIVSVEVETVSVVDGQVVPDRMREKIRSQGPTTINVVDGARFDRQHLDEDGHVSI